MHQLNAMGITLALDDFGTGYSSMVYLEQMSLNVLRIDKGFVDKMTYDEADNVLVKAMIALAHGLNLNCVAEGVETATQLELLREQGCNCVQGLLINKSLSAQMMRQILEQGREPA